MKLVHIVTVSKMENSQSVNQEFFNPIQLGFFIA